MISLKPLLPESASRWVKETNPLSRIYRDRRRITPRPAFMYIEVTTRCNLSCRMCCRDTLKPGEIRDLEFERFQAIVNEAEAFPGIAFHLYGIGEPLLYPHLPEAVDYVRSRFPQSDIVINTNGRLLRGDMADLVLTSDQILISINAGTEESYSWLTRSDGYREVTENVEAFLALRRDSQRYRATGRPAVSLQLLETGRTRGEEAAFRQRWEPHLGNSAEINVKRLTNWGGAIDTNPLRSDTGDNGRRYPCLYLWRSVAVDVNADVFPCCEALGRRRGSSLHLGNLREQRVASLYFSILLAHVRHLHLAARYEELADCRACDIYRCHRNVWCRLPRPILGRHWI
jgi:sulfatase maturation enzyme AslB (radical SAM superfamily)